MKIWTGYGTEHSANLVIVGTFKNINDAEQAEELICSMTKIVRNDEKKGLITPEKDYSQFSDELLQLIKKTNFAALDCHDPEALLYDFDMQRKENIIDIHTEENKYQLLLNIMVQKGAKIEIFSAHNYPSPYSRR